MKHFFVGIQILLLIFLFLSGPIFISSFPLNFIQLFSMFFICWALYERWGNKKHIKRKSFGTYIIKTGPYEFIRHPVYVGILLFVACAAQGEFTLLRLLDFLIFLTIVILSTKRDEKQTLNHFKHEYTEYSKKTKRIIPFVY